VSPPPGSSQRPAIASAGAMVPGDDMLNRLSDKPPRFRGKPSVSCTSSENCTATGYQTVTDPEAGVTDPLVLRYNGAGWSVQSLPTAPSGDLEKVACPNGSNCASVGSAEPTAQTRLPLYGVSPSQW
jgi:hypothetical protein